MEKMQFVCPKCGCHEFVQDQFQATGGTMAKLFDIQNKKFIAVKNVDIRKFIGQKHPQEKIFWIS